MRAVNLSLTAIVLLALPLAVARGPEGGAITGKITFTGRLPKPKLLDLSKEPECAKLHPKGLLSEDAVGGTGNTLQNVVVYLSGGEEESAPPPASAASFDQKGCHYTTHVLAVRAGQEVSISNSDPLSHNIHPLAKINREWNRIQLPYTPPFSYAYQNEEFIPIKCNIHPWMKAYFAVLKTSHFAVTGSDGLFTISGLSPGKYTLTAWHETLGVQRKEILVTPGEPQGINFVFKAEP